MINNFLSWYAIMNESDSEDMSTLVSYANNVSNGILMPLVLLTVFIISVVGATFSGQSISRSITFGGFFCSILSIFLVLLNMLNVNFMYFCFFITGLGLVWTHLVNSPS